MKTIYISSKCLQRLPFYLNYLYQLEKNGKENVSATNIANALNFNDVQVRKDLALVSILPGKPKIGYSTKTLINDLENFLGYHTLNEALIVGVGHLGAALLAYKGFEAYGLKIAAAFDNDSKVIGKEIHGIKIKPLSDLQKVIRESNIKIGIISVPYQYAQDVADNLIESGIRAIWNFAPTKLKVRKDIIVQDENMASSLAILSRRLGEQLSIK